MDTGKKDPSTFFFVILNRGGVQMRNKEKNKMLTPEEKEAIVLEYLNDARSSYRRIAGKYDVSETAFKRWKKAYLMSGISGLISQTGKHHGKHNNGLKGLHIKKKKTREEELLLENIKLKVEVARLKKGYQVKGVGSKKEYVTIKDLNTKS